MENLVREDTEGTFEQVDAKYELLKRGQYVLDRGAYAPVAINPKGPLQLAEAQNAVEIGRLAGAEQYAPDTFQKAATALRNAENLMLSHGGKAVETNAQEAVQMGEDARIITYRKVADEQLANERSAREQELARERAAAEEAHAKAEAAEADRQAAATVQAQKDQADTEKSQMRERLLRQLNTILETRETARGLIVELGDVLFDFNKYTLRPGAREKMAKVAGILMTYPGLQIQLEGHTHSVRGDEYNMVLSTNRANSVRTFLIEQGVPSDNITVAGLGKAAPVASNDTAAGRQQNRRVELVVSGQSIGSRTAAPAEP